MPDCGFSRCQKESSFSPFHLSYYTQTAFSSASIYIFPQMCLFMWLWPLHFRCNNGYSISRIHISILHYKENCSSSSRNERKVPFPRISGKVVFFHWILLYCKSSLKQSLWPAEWAWSECIFVWQKAWAYFEGHLHHQIGGN